ncbi:MAG: hypothetical protein WBQ94_04540 [Terracidiphilus sp.]
MIRTIPSDFGSHDDWLLYVRREIPVPEQPYALALGRIDLFRSFYLMQGLPFPIPVAQEFERIEILQDPEQTAALEALNGEVLRNLTVHLFNQAQSNASESDSRILPSPREQIQELRNHLAQQNPYFGLWVVYKRDVKDHPVTEEWREYLLQELGARSAEEIAFAHAMVELEKLLTLFHDGNRVLPGLSFERIWFLHSLRGPERMLQTRAVLGMLTTELTACASA